MPNFLPKTEKPEQWTYLYGEARHENCFLETPASIYNHLAKNALILNGSCARCGQPVPIEIAEREANEQYRTDRMWNV